MAAGLYDITNEILGKGHFAIVKLAKHCLTGELVAIKIIDKSKLNNDGLDQLKHEIGLWSILSENEHPNIVKLYQCIDTRTKLYLVMEYCGGQVCDLFDYLQKQNDGNGLDEDEARIIFRQLCNAIHYCHSLKIVHRDLKPENILIINNAPTLTNDGLGGKLKVKEETRLSNAQPVVKLIDFGFSGQWVEDEMLRTSCGSLAYSAPEILLGNHYYGPKVDVWSLGCILYILLFGSNPFMQFNDNETLTKILDCSFKIPNKDLVNETSIDLIKSLLKRHPDERLSIEQVLHHVWLQSNSSDKIQPPPVSEEIKHEPSPSGGKINFLDHIIDQMILQGIELPKEHIHKILKNEVQHIEMRTDDGTTAVRHEDRRVNDHHYIKATYHLLKDKSLRERKGTNANNSNTNYTKRGNIMKKANFKRTTDQSSKINESKPLTKRATAAEIRAANLRLKANQSNLDVPQGGNSFALPLARKCSIVSEEGSVCTEHNFSESSPQVIPERRESDPSQRRTDDKELSEVNIFVTDSSSSQNLISETFCDYEKFGKSSLTTRKEPMTTLHPVSSSPDFMNTLKLDEETKGTNVQSSGDICESGHRPGSDIFIAEFDKLNNARKGSEGRIKLLTPRSVQLLDSANKNSKAPSMRVIIQSKSMNNIALSEEQVNCRQTSNTGGNGGGELKMPNSISSVNIKQTKSDKADCCAIS